MSAATNSAAQRAIFEKHLALFQPDDPYDGFPVDEHPVDWQGWGSAHPFFDQVIEQVKPQIIVEIGTWKGLSAINMANLQKAAGIAGVVLCVDTWLGSSEHIIDPVGSWSSAALRRRNGYPRLFHTFMANVIAAGHRDRIIPIPNTSETVALVLAHYGLSADVIYIDGAHEEGPVRCDIEAYWPLLADDGVMILDDYVTWPGVTAAVDAFVAEHKPAGVVPAEGKFLLSRRPLDIAPWQVADGLFVPLPEAG
jgi:predicted O-methyltransferase YrrM